MSRNHGPSPLRDHWRLHFQENRELFDEVMDDLRDFEKDYYDERSSTMQRAVENVLSSEELKGLLLSLKQLKADKAVWDSFLVKNNQLIFPPYNTAFSLSQQTNEENASLATLEESYQRAVSVYWLLKEIRKAFLKSSRGEPTAIDPNDHIRQLLREAGHSLDELPEQSQPPLSSPRKPGARPGSKKKK